MQNQETSLTEFYEKFEFQYFDLILVKNTKAIGQMVKKCKEKLQEYDFVDEEVLGRFCKRLERNL